MDEFEGIELEADDDALAVGMQIAMMNDLQDTVIEMLCSFRMKLLQEGFSEEAAEQMVVDYHHQLREP